MNSFHSRFKSSISLYPRQYPFNLGEQPNHRELYMELIYGGREEEEQSALAGRHGNADANVKGH